MLLSRRECLNFLSKLTVNQILSKDVFVKRSYELLSNVQAVFPAGLCGKLSQEVKASIDGNSQTAQVVGKCSFYLTRRDTIRRSVSEV